jgi:transcriptional regulator with XRE-family HTH domain
MREPSLAAKATPARQSGSHLAMGETFVSQLERDEGGASLKTLFRLAAVLRLRASEIVRSVEEELRMDPNHSKSKPIPQPPD